tara:strand:+ start:4037 stop:4702 length:666 start_codon:yes stop_codon:yes gene_type:complete
MLDPLPILFEEESHRYLWEPTQTWMTDSVTSVTGFDMPEKKRLAIEAHKHKWAPRGIAVHSALERFFCTMDFCKDDSKNKPRKEYFIDEYPEYAKWIEPLLDHPFIRDHFEPIAVEYRVCDLKNTIGGTLDALGVDKRTGNKVLIDLKTQSSARANTYSTDQQLGAYLSMLVDHHAMKIDECRTVWSRPEKTYVGEIQDPDQCLEAWVDKLDLFKMTKEAF